jgi:hypothetical protein
MRQDSLAEIVDVNFDILLTSENTKDAILVKVHMNVFVVLPGKL